MVTCFSPCIADRDAADGMHIAKGDQETVCSQAAKFGKIAKDRERQRLDEKNNKGKKKEQVMTSIPRDINDLNSAHDFAAPSPVPDAANKPKNAASGSAKGGAGGNGSALSGAKGAKDLAGGDKQIPLAGSGAAGTFAMSLYTFGVAAVAMALL
ncbi:hypothetical protein GGI04_003883 [Coemansia thaxteri]|nr:hypothetical protein GGI04_003883 [Coemansia thaxteri]